MNAFELFLLSIVAGIGFTLGVRIFCWLANVYTETMECSEHDPEYEFVIIDTINGDIKGPKIKEGKLVFEPDPSDGQH